MRSSSSASRRPIRGAAHPRARAPSIPSGGNSRATPDLSHPVPRVRPDLNGAQSRQSPASQPDAGSLAPRRRLPNRVLHVIQTAGTGGTESVFSALSEHLQANGWSVLCAVGQRGRLTERLHASGLPVVLIPGLGQGTAPEVRSLAALYRTILTSGAQLVHAWSFPAHFYASLAARLARRPCIVNIRNGHHDTAGWRRLLLWRRLILPLATTVVVPSQGIARLLSGTLGLQETICIPNGVDVNARSRARSRRAVRESLGMPAEAIVVGAVGTLRPVKGHRYLLQAAVQATACAASLRFLLIGRMHEPTTSALTTFCRRAKLGDRVAFLGARSDVADLLSAMDIFCLPSLSEGMPNSVLEAMAAGLPVVATDVGGNPEVVVDGETGCLVPPRDPSALAAALVRLAGDPQLRSQMGRAGLARASAHFSLHRMLTHYEDLYRSVLGRAWARQGHSARSSGREPTFCGPGEMP